jgi:hypothetical protein
MTPARISARRAERKASPLFEIASLLVRFDHVASFIVNAGDGVIWAGRKTRLPQPLLLSGSTSTGGLATEALQE